jgi:flagellar basal-body rod protein FlgG
MLAQQMNVDTISNNLANVNTPGFKKGRVEFQELMYQTVREPGAPGVGGQAVAFGIQVGHGVRPASSQRIFSVGTLQTTESDLDMAVEGRGFFQVQRPDGTIAYTRDGSFHLDGFRTVATSQGLRVLGQSGLIAVPAGAANLTVLADGTVTAQLPGEAEPTILGKLDNGPISLPEMLEGMTIDASGRITGNLPGRSETFLVGRVLLADFPNPSGAGALGANLYEQTFSSGEPFVGGPTENGLGDIRQYTLELSNVQVVDEMVSLIMAQRAYEINSKAIQSADEMLAQANNLRR